MTFDEWWELHGSKWALPNERLIAKQAWQAATLAEQEECAKVCDEYAKESSNPMNFAENCAAAIRARNEGGR